jgi:hypothetical protein
MFKGRQVYSSRRCTQVAGLCQNSSQSNTLFPAAHNSNFLCACYSQPPLQVPQLCTVFANLLPHLLAAPARQGQCHPLQVLAEQNDKANLHQA